MKYNFRIFEKRYKNKTIAEILEILDGYADRITKELRCDSAQVINDIKYLKSTYRRIAFYGHNNRVLISLNKVK